ncbi:MAG: hypothetical protein JSW67_07520 [Candidatus Latescibacterota bacterium]|nr:MAG: hypothetical protein JSW67_07520 [Candidatus Latescibacterota bacterium]
MHRYVRVPVYAVLLVGFLATGALGIDPDWLTGRWVGERDGLEVVWELDEAGRLRAGSRTASWEVSADTLVVTFDPVSSDAAGEIAVYRVFASPPDQVLRRLFVYGFDLGESGLHLTLHDPDAALQRATPAMASGVENRRSSGNGRGVSGSGDRP